MKTALLIVLITLSGTRKEAAKRWPAPDAQWRLSVDQTKTTYVYELEVDVQELQFQLVEFRCAWKRYAFKGKNWQAVLDASVGVRSTCKIP